MLGVYVWNFGFGASLYFVSMIIFGNIMMLNLFLAILLNSISSGGDDEEEEEELLDDDDDSFAIQDKKES